MNKKFKIGLITVVFIIGALIIWAVGTNWNSRIVRDIYSDLICDKFGAEACQQLVRYHTGGYMCESPDSDIVICGDERLYVNDEIIGIVAVDKIKRTFGLLPFITYSHRGGSSSPKRGIDEPYCETEISYRAGEIDHEQAWLRGTEPAPGVDIEKIMAMMDSLSEKIESNIIRNDIHADGGNYNISPCVYPAPFFKKLPIVDL